MDFLEAHEEALVHSAWQSITNEETSTPYLFKFSYDENDLSCCFLLTDTKVVWVEVMARRHVLRRAERFDLIENDTDDDYAARKTLSSLIKLHSFPSAESLTTTFHASPNADLFLQLSIPNFSWQWELDALPRAYSAELISKHLIMPMLTWSGYVMDSYMEALSTEHQISQLERALDASGRTAKRHVDKMVASVVRQPLFSTSIRRLTETGSGSGTRSAIFRSREDEPAPRLRAPSPPASAGPSSGPQNYRSTARTREPTTPMKEESLVPKVEPSMSPVPGRAPRVPSVRAEGEEEEEMKREEEHASSETETEPEEDQLGPKAEEEEGEEGEERYPRKRPVKHEELEDEEEEEYTSRRTRTPVKRDESDDEDVDEDEGLPKRRDFKHEDYEDEESAEESAPARSTRGALRRKRVKPESSLSPAPQSPTPDRRKRRRNIDADEDENMDADVPVMKKEESEDEKPAAKKTFVPKSRVHVKRSKY
ncbi:hypothetical protein CALCODRAFT_481478 [Calocera cornea HHB12733]|uniref:XLF-like N-terminal domain-containing protein n=1 Tax=Calocera cornea HHB12733 TaxID=1353952 RepID=A0A165HQ24_9BASI|nr:hypothetical protein CALCODRAFT_481478 [Calocera cornea HHB12733]